ncbi:MAG: cytochrome b [Alphaproteobacteria bacterium]
MRWRDTAERFGTVSIINHWLLAAVVIGLLASGLIIGELVGEGAIRNALLGPHKAVGVLVLALVAWLPLWWALQGDRPGAIPGTPPLEAFARKAMHVVLLAGTAILTLSGIVMATFKGNPVDAWLFTIPAQSKTPWLASAANDVHVIGGWILTAAVVGHALVALKHHLVNHDATLARMIGKTA